MELIVTPIVLWLAFAAFFKAISPAEVGCLIKLLATAIWKALRFTSKGLLWVCVRSGRGGHFSVLLLYFLIDEKFRGARQEEFDESEREQPEEPAETASSETAYQAALATLGLEPGVTRDVLNKAYKKMMVKVHPDMPGGSTRAAQALNTSRDLVMNWNRWT